MPCTLILVLIILTHPSSARSLVFLGFLVSILVRTSRCLSIISTLPAQELLCSSLCYPLRGHSNAAT